MTEAQELWERCAAAIRSEVSEATWRTWFDGIAPLRLDDSVLRLSVPNALVKERLVRRFAGVLEDAVAEATGRHLEVDLDVRPNARSSGPDESSATTPAAVPPSVDLAPVPGGRAATNESTGAGGLATDVLGDDARWGGNGSLRPIDDDQPATSHTFDRFVIGPSNRFAHAAALSVAEAPARAYNPLFIIGAVGLGKTHLLRAIRNYVTDNFPRLHVRYVSTETFMNEFVDAIRTNATGSFKRRYRESDVLLIDDIQFLEGKESLQEEFFHTFNTLHEASKQVVLSSDRPPGSIATLESRLRSRFLSGLIADIQPPELETRIAILRTKAMHERTPVDHEVLEFIASNVKDNIRELEGALIRVTAYASLTRQPLNRELAESVLADLVAGHQPRRITAQQILSTTADHFGFAVDELCGPSRRRPLVLARQIGMYVFRELTDFSYPAIAREFGGRDHTTVIHAVEKIAALMKERKQVYDQVIELRERIRSGE